MLGCQYVQISPEKCIRNCTRDLTESAEGIPLQLWYYVTHIHFHSLSEFAIFPEILYGESNIQQTWHQRDTSYATGYLIFEPEHIHSIEEPDQRRELPSHQEFTRDKEHSESHSPEYARFGNGGNVRASSSF